MAWGTLGTIGTKDMVHIATLRRRQARYEQYCIYGWEGIGKVLGVCPRTARKWKTVYDLPVSRLACGTVFTTYGLLDVWVSAHRERDWAISNKKLASITNAREKKRLKAELSKVTAVRGSHDPDEESD